MTETEEAYPSAVAAALPIALLHYDLRAAYYIKLDIKPGTVKQINCVNVLQFVDGPRRVAIWNEWYRLLEPGGRAYVVVPYYSHMQAFANPLIQWPPFSEFSFYFLDKQWRSETATRHVDGLECDLVVDAITPEMDAAYATRTQEFKDEALRWYWNCAVQLTVWLVKR